MRASEQKFRALFEQSQEGIILLDSRGRVIGWNAVQEHLTGIRTEEVIGHYVWDDPDRVDIDDHNTITNRTRFNEELKKVLETRNSPLLNHLSEIEMRTRQGLYHVCLSVMILIDMGDDFMVALVSQDITERKIIEKALQESEEKYRNLIQNVKMGVFRTVPEHQGRIVEANKAMEEITGYSRDELIGLEAVKLYSHIEERAEFIRKLMLHPEKATLTSHLRRKDGTRITTSMIATAIIDQNGKLLYIDGTIEDITERKLMEEQILDLYEKEKKQRQELQEEARTRGMFIDVLAHELRTPLTPILASIGMLNELLDDEGDIRKRLAKNINNGATMLSKRLEDLLELARFSRGTFKLDKQSVHAVDYFNEVLVRFKPSIDQRGQYLVTDIVDNLPEVEIDQSRLEQVVVNLLSNASKFSLPGGRITFRAGTNAEGLLIEVQDEGIGISAEEIKRIFQPYHRVEQDRHKFPGLGLGLAVSKQIVEAHGGKIWVTSEPDHGSTFHFMIPIAAK
jgi:PAS domain S-box-containing protein